MEPFFVDYMERMHTLIQDFNATFEDLPAEALDWVPGADMNTFCILVVHVAGATRFWVGDVAFEEPSNRNRPQEFQASGLSAADLKARFATVEAYVRSKLEAATLADLATMHSFRHPMGHTVDASSGKALLQALDHIGLHLGHAQITRQLWQQHTAPEI